MPKPKRPARSPIKTVILPRPARTLRERFYIDCWTVASTATVAGCVMAVVAVGSLLDRFFPGNGEVFRWWFAGLMAVLALGTYLRLRRRIENLSLGIDGEMEVGQFLEELREHGYRIFHSIDCDGFDIDHAIIGRAGVFAIETKTISKRGGAEERVTYDGQKLLVGGREPDRDPLTQAKALSRQLGTILSEQTGETIRAKPIVVFPGWYVTCSAPQPEVRVFNPKQLAGYLRSLPDECDQKTINRLAAALVNHQRLSEKARNA